MNAVFDEVDSKYDEASFWTYSFRGDLAINSQFSYFFSVDYGGQGGTDDSQYISNWFIEGSSSTSCLYISAFHHANTHTHSHTHTLTHAVEARSGHCGGGCHVSYLHRKEYWNG
jgi:hypothetical protein